MTSGFSKRLANHRAAIALHMSWYNVCRVHETLRCTPAMAVGVTDHVWTIGELVDAALNAPEPTPLVPTQLPLKGLSAGKAKGEKAGRRPSLHIIRGGRR